MISAANKNSTPMAIGIEYQKAITLIVASTISICSVPYATDDKASEERIANAFKILSFCSPNAVDFNGRPIKNLLTEESK